MAFRKAAKARTKVANPARRRRKHRSAKAANPHRAKRRASRKRNGYMGAMAKRSHKRRNGYKRRNPEVGGYKLDGMTIALAAGAGASTAMVTSLLEKSGLIGKLGIETEANQKIAAAAASAAVGAGAAYLFRGKPKVKKFFMFHAVISAGVAVFAAAKAKTDEYATMILPASDAKGLYLSTGHTGAFGHGQMAGGYMSLTDGRFVTDTGGSFVSPSRSMNGY